MPDIRDGDRIEGLQLNTDADAAERSGVGLLLEGRRDVVLRGAEVRGFWQNVVLRGCRNVTIDGGDFSHSLQPALFSGETYDQRDWLDIFDEAVWRTYGAGIVLEDCEDCSVIGARASGAQNGVMLINSRSCTVSGCDFSHNSGWGIWMWKSSDNLLTGNDCSWCVRCEDPERYSAGGDSAGIMLSNDNCRNVITHNDLRFGGDGFFLNGLRVAPSEHNTVAFNDASHSPHNAFESSFSGGNRFIGNIASNSRFGFWCGYSHHNEFVGNVIENCLEWGIAIEHGHHNRIVGNELRRNKRGIVLFRREADAQASRGYQISGNVITGGEAAVTLSETEDVLLLHNELEADAAVELKKGARDVRLGRCNVRGAEAVRAEPGCAAHLSGCYLEGAVSEGVAIAGAVETSISLAAPPVTAQPSDPAAREDHVFRWYDRRKNLIGTAEV